jgi:hypothetical protein
VNDVQLSTVAAIAKRNIDKPSTAVPASAVAARDLFTDQLVESLPDVTEENFDALDGACGRVLRHLVRRANAEPYQPHRPAILAWFSGDPDTEAGDVLDWAQREVARILPDHGSLLAWHERETARDAAEAVIAARADVLRQSGMLAHEAVVFARSISDDLETT